MAVLNESPRYLYAILFTNGYIFLKSSYGKFSEGKFVDGLAATLTKSAANNPYPPVKDFLNNIAIPNSHIFGTLTMWGELLVAITLISSLLYLFFKTTVNKLWYLALALGCFGGMLLNGVFWLALGYTSVSTGSLNLLMFVVETIGLIFATNKFFRPIVK